MTLETARDMRCPVNADYNPFEAPLLQDPYSWLRAQRAEDPVFFSPAIGMWVATRYSDIEGVLRQPDLFSSENALMGSLSAEVVAKLNGEVPMSATLIGMDRPDHTRLRRIINAAFTPARVSAMEDSIRALAVDLIDRLPQDDTFDVLATFAYPLTLTVIGDLIGIPRSDIEPCHDWAQQFNELFAAEARGMPVDEQLALADAGLAYHRYIAELISERGNAPADDLISAVWEVRRGDDAHLSDMEMLSLFPGLISAGHETTAALIGNALWHLLQTPDEWEALTRNQDEIASLVEEMLRFDTSVYGMPRRAVRDTRIGDVAIAAGELVFLHFASAGHDPEKFSDPDEFTPSRERPQHLSFGRGAHFCLGAPLARLETRIALEELARRRPSLRLVEQPTHAPNLIFRGLTELLVRASPPGA